MISEKRKKQILITSNYKIRTVKLVQEIVKQLMGNNNIIKNAEDIINYDLHLYINVESLKALSGIRKGLREILGGWKDHVYSIEVQGCEGLKKAIEKDNKVEIKYISDILKDQDCDNYNDNQDKIGIQLYIPYSKFPKDKFSKGSNCDFVESPYSGSNMNLVCSVK